MSIGEIVSLYKEQELDIKPDFQREYRWTPQQKINLIETVLLNLPMPNIFVYQNKSSTWELVDGLQRISTILEFMGELKTFDRSFNEEKCQQPFSLKSTKFLSNIKNYVFDDNCLKLINEAEIRYNVLPTELRLHIKRYRIDVVIITNDSSEDAKFEVFNRLNTGGSQASHQEVRNNLLLMADKGISDWFIELSENKDFKNTLSITSRAIQEQYHRELTLRFIGLCHFGDKIFDQLKTSSTKNNNQYVMDFLDLANENLIKLPTDIRENIKEKFIKVFKLLNLCLGDRSFKKYKSQAFNGAFNVVVFDVISQGLYCNVDDYDISNCSKMDMPDESSGGDEDLFVKNPDLQSLKEKIQELYSNETFKTHIQNKRFITRNKSTPKSDINPYDLIENSYGSFAKSYFVKKSNNSIASQ